MLHICFELLSWTYSIFRLHLKTVRFGHNLLVNASFIVKSKKSQILLSYSLHLLMDLITFGLKWMEGDFNIYVWGLISGFDFWVRFSHGFIGLVLCSSILIKYWMPQWSPLTSRLLLDYHVKLEKHTKLPIISLSLSGTFVLRLKMLVFLELLSLKACLLT